MFSVLGARKAFSFSHCTEGTTEVQGRWLSHLDPTASGRWLNVPVTDLICPNSYPLPQQLPSAPIAALCPSQVHLLAVAYTSDSHSNLCIFPHNFFPSQHSLFPCLSEYIYPCTITLAPLNLSTFYSPCPELHQTWHQRCTLLPDYACGLHLTVVVDTCPLVPESPTLEIFP